MAAPTIYRSTDANAPVLTGAAGTLIALLDATLVSGYGAKAAAGWTKPFTGATNQAVYRQPAGSRFYLQVDDTGPGAGGVREARCFGFETMTAYNVGTGQFPTVAQSAAGSVLRKSTTLDSTARAWTAVVDDRTFYLFTSSGDTAGNYFGFSFGDFYSLVAADAYKCLIMGGSTESASAVSSSYFGRQASMDLPGAFVGHWLPRNYSGLGGSTNFNKVGDYGLNATASLLGVVGFPNPSDGGLYVAPIRIFDSSIAGTTPSGTIDLRGRLRGLYHVGHASASFTDGDTFTGSGEFAGRSFTIVKFLLGSGASTAFAAIETTAWDVST